jgi:hypothetical protein
MEDNLREILTWPVMGRFPQSCSTYTDSLTVFNVEAHEATLYPASVSRIVLIAICTTYLVLRDHLDSNRTA